MTKLQKKKQKRRKSGLRDFDTEEALKKKIIIIEERRRKIIAEIHKSLQQRRMDKRILRDATLEKEERAFQKQHRDSKKTGSEKTMLEVREQDYSF